MALRSFFALDSANLVVDSSSNASIVGNPIINNSDTPNGTIFTYSGGGGTTVTLDDTGGSSNTFDDDDEAQHVITDGGGIVSNGTEVEAESLIFVRALDGDGNQIGPVITITVFSQGGVTSDVWGFSPDIALEDGVSYVKTGGSNNGDSAYNSFITCFGPGTTIETATGIKAVEEITLGDMVWTLDNGFQPVRWVSKSSVPGTGAFAPVVFAAGTIGNADDLIVSQEHRMYLESDVAGLLFGEAQVLIAAKHLCGLPGVALRPQSRIDYTHFMFDRHQIIRANGALSESFFLSETSVTGVARAQVSEILALFPSLAQGIAAFGATAARALKASEASVLRAYLA